MSKRKQPLGDQTPLEHVRPAGPTVEQFILDFDHRVQGIMGPVGGGKTTGCIQKVCVIAAIQPVCKDGAIRSKGVVLRDTFRDLEKTVLSDWFDWFPKEMKDPLTGADMWDFSGGNDRPAVHTRRWKSARGIIESITEFIGIGEQRIENITRGARWTWAWPNEWDLLHVDVIDAINKRLPRYPPRRWLLDPKETPIPFLFGDFNAPDMDNWTHKRFIEEREKRPNYKLYIQPGGMEPNAENKQNLPAGYYEEMVANDPEWQVRRFVHNKFGFSRWGQPVYPEFNEFKHVADRELMPVRGLPLRIGKDAGGSPAAMIMQLLPNGQLRWLDEVVTYPGTGPERFARTVTTLLAGMKYQGCGVELIVVDPSAIEGADKDDGKLSWAETVARAVGAPWRPHFTNEPAQRQSPVRWRLEHDIDGRIPSLLISPTCKIAIKGMAHAYHYEKTKKDPDAPLKPRPEKNEFSHVCEAGEYGTGSYETGRDSIINRDAHRGAVYGDEFDKMIARVAAAKRASPGNFDPFKF